MYNSMLLACAVALEAANCALTGTMPRFYPQHVVLWHVVLTFPTALVASVVEPRASEAAPLQAHHIGARGKSGADVLTAACLLKVGPSAGGGG